MSRKKLLVNKITMSHNSKYYTKKIKLKHAVGTPDIRSSFGKVNLNKENSNQTSELSNKSESPQNDHQKSTEADPKLSEPSDPVTSENVLSVQPQCSELDVPVPSFQVSSSSNTTCMIGPVPPPVSKTKLRLKKKKGPVVPYQRRFYNLKYEHLYKSWLYYSGVQNGYLCKTCELFDNHTENKAFVTRGVKLGTHPTRQLELHQDSLQHKNANERLVLARSNVNVYRQLLLKENDTRMKNREALKKIFLCIDFLIQRKLAYTENTKALVEFVANLGVRGLQEHLNSKISSKYLSTTCINEMLLCTSDLFERDLLEDLRRKEFSLLADESSMAHRSQMSVMARFERHSVVSTYFLGFIELTKGTAEHIASALEGILVAKGVDI
ncbi:uncharacterized protein LOC123538819 [Mercenaria mercenaria]|uniref:uncharacterized protein LOC123538819 n=1 Tax=Mercenaria mercenaria TaxID=6596 RepID=UPI00234EF72B|nr:uncharacterized protein LOC123538819 [Mercenaria mercenaria]